MYGRLMRNARNLSCDLSVSQTPPEPDASKTETPRSIGRSAGNPRVIFSAGIK